MRVIEERTTYDKLRFFLQNTGCIFFKRFFLLSERKHVMLVIKKGFVLMFLTDKEIHNFDLRKKKEENR